MTIVTCLHFTYRFVCTRTLVYTRGRLHHMQHFTSYLRVNLVKHLWCKGLYTKLVFWEATFELLLPCLLCLALLSLLRLVPVLFRLAAFRLVVFRLVVFWLFAFWLVVFWLVVFGVLCRLKEVGVVGARVRLVALGTALYSLCLSLATYEQLGWDKRWDVLWGQVVFKNVDKSVLSKPPKSPLKPQTQTPSFKIQNCQKVHATTTYQVRVVVVHRPSRDGKHVVYFGQNHPSSGSIHENTH